MKKAKALDLLVSNGYNTHSWKVLNSLPELLDYAQSHPDFTIRFDSSDDRMSLPFFKFSGDTSALLLTSIAQQASDTKCTMLASDGYACRDLQVCDVVFQFLHSEIHVDLNFHSKFLREMYDENLVSARVNPRDCEIIINRMPDGCSVEQVAHIIFAILPKLNNTVEGYFYECTVYSKPVGVLKDPVVFWQVGNYDRTRNRH